MVSVDVKPGSITNSINVKSRGEIPVVVLTTRIFSASTVNPLTVRFGRTGTEAAPVHSALEDVDGDGDLDMILLFKTQDTGIQAGDTEAKLTGMTLTGRFFMATDSVHAFFPGDVNGDLKVNILDVALVAWSYGSHPGDARWNPNADFDDNNIIDILDRALVAYYYGTHA